MLAANGRIEGEGVLLKVDRVTVPRDTRASGIFLGSLCRDVAERPGLVWSEESVRGRPVVSLGGRGFVGLEVNGV